MGAMPTGGMFAVSSLDEGFGSRGLRRSHSQGREAFRFSSSASHEGARRDSAAALIGRADEVME